MSYFPFAFPGNTRLLLGMTETLGKHAIVLRCLQWHLIISYTHGRLTDTVPCPVLSPREYPLEAYGEKT